MRFTQTGHCTGCRSWWRTSCVADTAETTAVRSVVDADIQSHIFEQSITDLERVRLRT